MSEVRVFCALPELGGYTENGFEFDVAYKIFQSDPMQVIEDTVHLICPVGSLLGSTFANLYGAIVTRATQSDFPTPALSDVTFYAPFTLEKLAQGQSSVTRTLDSAFQISTTSNNFVNYSVDVVSTSTISGGEQGTVYLEVADDSGFTTNVQEVSRATNGNTGTLTIGLSNTQTFTARLAGAIKSSKYVRLRTQQNTGTSDFTYRSGQEVIV